MSRVLSISIAVLLLSSVAMAEDLVPPPWPRGDDGTTMARWEFLDPNPNPIPNIEVNPYGPSVTSVYPGVGQEWWEIWGNRDGVIGYGDLFRIGRRIPHAKKILLDDTGHVAMLEHPEWFDRTAVEFLTA